MTKQRDMYRVPSEKAYRQAFTYHCTATRILNKRTHARQRCIPLLMRWVLQSVFAGAPTSHRMETLVPAVILSFIVASSWPARGPAMARTGPGTGPGRGPVEKLEGCVKPKKRVSKD